jgi:hypothetical protein
MSRITFERSDGQDGARGASYQSNVYQPVAMYLSVE